MSSATLQRVEPLPLAGAEQAAVRERVYAAAKGAVERKRGTAQASGSEEAEGTAIRVAVNELLVRLGASVMVVAKGSGYVRGSRAERLLREAAFFLVWSAPDAVRAGTLGAMWGETLNVE